MTYQKAVTDAVTGETILVDLSPVEVAEIEAKILANKTAAIEQAASERAAEVQAEIDNQLINKRPLDSEITSAKTIDELKGIVLRQNALIALLITKSGLN